jgi:hypothetical protein
VKPKNRAGWSDDPLQRIEAALKRVRKRSDPFAQRMLKGLLKKRRELKRLKRAAAAIGEVTK